MMRAEGRDYWIRSLVQTGGYATQGSLHQHYALMRAKY